MQTRILMCASVALSLLAVTTQEPRSAVSPDQRYEDLQHLVAEMTRMHPDLFFGVDEEEFTAARHRLEDSLGDLTDDQFAVEVMRLVALVSRSGRDGHALALPMGRFHAAPVRLYSFADGWHVVAARAPYEELVGRRVTAIHGTPVEQVAERLAPLVPRDNEHDLRAKLPMYLLMPELLHALGIGEDREHVTVTMVDGDEERDVELAGMPLGPYFGWSMGIAPLPPDEDVLWLSDPGRAWWMRVLEQERALYVQYNAVRTTDDDGVRLHDFAAELVRTFEEDELERVVLDVRYNGGGDNTTFRPLITAIHGSEALNRRGRLYALVGRHTFSAAGNFVTVLERDTEAILVGEPTGGAPNQYGDARSVSLPHHPWLLVRIATRFHAFGGPEDERLTHVPELAVELTAVDYFAGRDPVLARALER